MQDHEKTKDQLIDELNEMRIKVAELEAAEVKLSPLISGTIGEEAAIERLTEIVADDVLKEKLLNLGSARELTATDDGNQRKFQKSLEMLLKSAEDYVDLYNNAPNAYFSIGTDGNIIRANPRAGKLLGIPHQDLIGRPIFDFYADTPAGKQKARTVFSRFKAGEDILDEELQMQRVGGALIWISLTVNAVRDASGQITGSRSMVVDIAGRRRAEEALRESEERYRTLVDISPDGILVDVQGHCVYANDAAAILWGFKSSDELIGKGPLSVIHPESWEAIKERMRIVQEDRKSVPWAEEKYLRPDGTIVHAEVAATPVVFQGQPGILAIFRDITERKRAEEALKAEKQRFQSLGENSPFGIVLIQPDGTFSYVNPKFKEMFGYDLSDVPNGRGWFRKAYPDNSYRREVISTWIEHVKGSAPGETRPKEFSVTCKDGSEKIIHFRPVKLDSGEDLMTCEDITEHKRAQSKLTESEERYRAMFENMKSGVAVYEPVDDGQDFVFRDFNRAGEHIEKVRKEDLIGKRLLEIFSGADEMGILGCLRRVHRTGKSEYLQDTLYIDRDRQGWRENFIYRLPSGEIVAIYEDVTERKRAVEALRASEEKYRSLVESISDVIFEIDRRGVVTYISPVVRNVFGYEAEDLIGKTFLEFVYPEDSDLLIKRFAEFSEGIDYPLEYRLVAKSSEVRYVRTYTRPIMKENIFEGARGTLIDITERKRAEKELREREQTLHSILRASPVGIIHTQDRRIKWANQVWEEMFGFEHQHDYVDKPTSTMHPSEAHYEQVRQTLYDHVKPTGVSEADAILQRRDGRHFDAHIRINVLDPTDSTRGSISTITDISERRVTEEALRLSEEKYRILVEKAQEGILIAQDGILCFVNSSALEIIHYEAGELLSKPFTEFIHLDDRDMVLQYHFRRLRGEAFSSRYSFRIVRKDGQIRWVEIDSGLISWEGRPAALIFITDITERKQMEEELRQSEERYRTIVENSFDGIFIQKGPKIIFVNSCLYEMLGYSPGELEGMDHWLVYHPDYRDVTRQRAIARMRGEEVTPQYEVMLQKKDGASFLAEISARLVQVGGEPGIQVWIRDISGLRRSEEAQRRLAIAVEQAAETIVMTDTTGTIQYVNPAFEHVTGYSHDEAIGQNSRILQSGRHDQAFYRKLWQTITNGEAWTGQFVNKKKDGTLYREDASISPVRDSSGNIVNYVAVKRDISRESQLQAQLLHAQKMEAVGTLAGGIAHDFNNLLQVVLGYTELVLQRKQKDEQDYADLEKVYLAGQRGADLIQRLLMFSRKTEPIFTPVNLNQEVLQAEKLLSRTIPKTIKINLHLSGDLELVQADPSQIGQILMNLGVNARDAMRDGGTLTIETAMVELDEEYCKTHLGAKSGRHVLLSVSDTGQGIAKKTLIHIFEPFFSTKKAGKGTGLGLATVYGIVKQHDGYIMCYSEPGHGTTFKIYLPAIQTEEESETPTEEMPIQGGTETILLVDDEDFIREFGTTLLDRLGYEVITADNGSEAIDIYERAGERISLVILDLIMPEMDGRQCLTEILRIDPKAKVLIASGYSENGPTVGLLTGARGFVQKPYNMRQLLQRVREVLDTD